MNLVGRGGRGGGLRPPPVATHFFANPRATTMHVTTSAAGGVRRLATRFPATLAFGGLLAVVAALEAGSARRAEPAVGVVRGVTPGGRSGITFAEVEVAGPAGPRVMSLRSWNARLAVGQVVRVRVRPAGPRSAVLDRAWDLDLHSIAGSAVVDFAALIEATADRPPRRRSAPSPVVPGVAS